jgi:anionic cell wall polymer biosynthesis LytR-Cps2A-Psr (LCP) family protein
MNGDHSRAQNQKNVGASVLETATNPGFYELGDMAVAR